MKPEVLEVKIDSQVPSQGYLDLLCEVVFWAVRPRIMSREFDVRIDTNDEGQYRGVISVWPREIGHFDVEVVGDLEDAPKQGPAEIVVDPAVAAEVAR